MGRYPSGQREQTVNLPAYAYGGSNPPRPTLSTLVRSSRAGADQPGLIGGDHRLRAVAGIELGENAADVGLHRLDADIQLGGDLVVGAPGGDESQHVDLAGGELGDAIVAGARADTDELVDEATRDVGCEQRVPRGDDAHGVEEGLGGDVLEQEAAG